MKTGTKLVLLSAATNILQGTADALTAVSRICQVYFSRLATTVDEPFEKPVSKQVKKDLIN